MSRHAGIPTQGGGRAAEMRTEFDLAFSRVPVSTETDLTDVLALRIGDEACLLRLSDIAEVIARPMLTPVPTSAPAMLGITAGRGVPVAGYDTGLLLGRSPVLPHWLVLVAAEPAIGLVFEHFDGYQQISNGSTGDRRLLEMPALIDAVTRLTRHRSPSQELRP
jgi:hypothetical protein